MCGQTQTAITPPPYAAITAAANDSSCRREGPAKISTAAQGAAPIQGGPTRRNQDGDDQGSCAAALTAARTAAPAATIPMDGADADNLANGRDKLAADTAKKTGTNRQVESATDCATRSMRHGHCNPEASGAPHWSAPPNGYEM